MKIMIRALRLFLFGLFFSAPVFAGLVDALNEISNEIESSGNPPSAPNNNPPVAPRTGPAAIPPSVPVPDYKGLPALSSNTNLEGNQTATYKNPDGSYTVVERDAGGEILSEKSFGQPAGDGTPILSASQGSTFVNIAADGSVKVENLASGSVTDVQTGTTVSVQANTDGTREVTTIDGNGQAISTENRGKEPVGGSSYDPATGKTVNSEAQEDGSRLVTTRDQAGNVLSQETRGQNEPVGASSYDPATGNTISSVRQADGSRVVTTTDRDGRVISQETRGNNQPIGGSSYDPATGNRVSSVRQADGSRAVTTTAQDGKVVSQQVQR